MKVTVIFEHCGSRFTSPGASSVVLVQRDLTVLGLREDLGDVKSIHKQFCVWKDREYSRQAAVSAVFGQGRVHSGTGRGTSTYPRGQEQVRQGTRGNATGQDIQPLKTWINLAAFFTC